MAQCLSLFIFTIFKQNEKARKITLLSYREVFISLKSRCLDLHLMKKKPQKKTTTIFVMIHQLGHPPSLHWGNVGS